MCNIYKCIEDLYTILYYKDKTKTAKYFTKYKDIKIINCST